MKGKVPEALVLGAIFLDLFGFGMLIPDVQYRAEKLGMHGWEIGAALTITFVLQFLLSPLWGKASDQVGRKIILVLCTAFSAAGLLTYGFASAAWVIFLSRALSGLGGANVAIAQAYLSDISSAEGRTAALGRLGAAVSAGLIAGSASLALPASSHVNVGFVAGSLSLMGVFLLLLLPNGQVLEPSKERRVLFDFTLLRSFPALRSLVIVAVVAWFSLATLEGTFGRLIEATLGFHRTQFGQIFAFEALVGVVVQGVLLAWIAKRSGDAPRLRIAYLAQGAGLAAMPFAPSLGVLFLMSALYAAGSGVANGTINGLCSRLAPLDRQGELFGLMQGARSVGFAIGPSLGGMMFDRMPSSPYLLAGGTCIAAALLVKVPKP